MIFNLAIAQVLGTIKKKIPPPQARRLTGSLPSSQAKYNRLLKAQLDQINFYPRAASLYRETEHSTMATPSEVQRLIALDEDKTACMRAAEDKCRKLRMGKVPYSNLLNTLGG